MKPSWLLLILAVCRTCSAASNVIEVRDAAQLRQVLSRLTPGTTLRLAAGTYPGGHTVRDVAELTVEGADPEHPPVFAGGEVAWQFSACHGLTLRHLRVRGQSHNGINLDDAGRIDTPMRRVTVEHVEIREIGPKGNFDGLKCSGLQDLTIRDCTVTGWGGEAIDLVGCHRVSITRCVFTGQEGFSQATGVQCKGGSEDVVIEECRFVDAGERPINAGGSTGRPYFRPADANYEARRITIRKNEIRGSMCAVAFVGVDGATFRENTILFPNRWIFRLLQETTAPEFVPSRNVTIEENAIVYRRDHVAQEINVGAKTAPETLRFAGNRWFAEDRPDRSKPRLPTVETDGGYGTDPREP